MTEEQTDRDHHVLFDHPTRGHTSVNFKRFEVHDDGSATLALADESGQIKLSRNTEWVVAPKDIVEGMIP